MSDKKSLPSGWGKQTSATPSWGNKEGEKQNDKSVVGESAIIGGEKKSQFEADNTIVEKNLIQKESQSSIESKEEIKDELNIKDVEHVEAVSAGNLEKRVQITDTETTYQDIVDDKKEIDKVEHPKGEVKNKKIVIISAIVVVTIILLCVIYFVIKGMDSSDDNSNNEKSDKRTEDVDDSANLSDETTEENKTSIEEQATQIETMTETETTTQADITTENNISTEYETITEETSEETTTEKITTKEKTTEETTTEEATTEETTTEETTTEEVTTEETTTEETTTEEARKEYSSMVVDGVTFEYMSLYQRGYKTFAGDEEEKYVSNMAIALDEKKANRSIYKISIDVEYYDTIVDYQNKSLFYDVYVYNADGYLVYEYCFDITVQNGKSREIVELPIYEEEFTCVKIELSHY